MKKISSLFLAILLPAALNAQEIESGEFTSEADEMQTLGYLGNENSRPHQAKVKEIKKVSYEKIKGKKVKIESVKAISYELEFAPDELKLSNEYDDTVQTIADSMSNNPTLSAKINSLGYATSGSHVDSRSAALQRAIEVRKALIEANVDPLRISVDAHEDMAGQANCVEVFLEGELEDNTEE